MEANRQDRMDKLITFVCIAANNKYNDINHMLPDNGKIKDIKKIYEQAVESLNYIIELLVSYLHPEDYYYERTYPSFDYANVAITPSDGVVLFGNSNRLESPFMVTRYGNISEAYSDILNNGDVHDIIMKNKVCYYTKEDNQFTTIDPSQPTMQTYPQAILVIPLIGGIETAVNGILWLQSHSEHVYDRLSDHHINVLSGTFGRIMSLVIKIKNLLPNS